MKKFRSIFSSDGPGLFICDRIKEFKSIITSANKAVPFAFKFFDCRFREESIFDIRINIVKSEVKGSASVILSFVPFFPSDPLFFKKLGHFISNQIPIQTLGQENIKRLFICMNENRIAFGIFHWLYGRWR